MESLPKLSNAEWEVIKPLWENGPMPARDVYAIVSRTQPWAYKTVKTMLARLVAKGALRYEKEGNAFRYIPIHSRAAMARDATDEFIMRVFDGRVEDLVATAADLPGARIKRLRARLKQIKKERDKAK